MDKLNQILDSLPYLLEGAVYTVAITAVALATGFIVGLVLALVRVYGSKPLSRLAAGYSAILRGLPPLVVLFILYYALATLVNLPPFLAGCVALGFASSAYQMELLRGAIQSVAPGQFLAARALGMTQMQAISHVVLPQALRLAIPSWSNEAAVVLKDTSLVYAVGLSELLRRAQQVAARTYQPFMVYMLAAVIYFFLTFITNRTLDRIERVYRLPGMVEDTH